MFRRKEEGMDEMFKDASTDVQIPPAPQSAEVSPDVAAATTEAPAAAPMEAATSPVAPISAYGAPAAKAAVPTPATPFRGPASTAASSNVTDLTGRNRFAETRNPTGSTSTMDKSSTAKSGSRRVLTVGNDILMKGEINSCDRIVIEGAVDATLKDVHTMEIAETGSFKGTAEVEEAEISGTVEGDLSVRGRLIIYSTGKVTGKITYGEIEIERGGQLTGEIKTSSTSAMSSSKAAA